MDPPRRGAVRAYCETIRVKAPRGGRGNTKKGSGREMRRKVLYAALETQSEKICP